MIEFHEYFARQIKLWGAEIQTSLKDKKIAIIGNGGLGCSIGIALGASGIGGIDLVDFDTVGVHNIHRQIGFKIEDEEKKKCDVLKELILSRSPFVEVDAIAKSFEEFTKENKKKYDLILDATDNLPVRALINSYSKKWDTPWIYGSVEEFHGQVCFFEQADFEQAFSISKRTPAGIAAPIVMHIASLQANLALRYLAGLPIKKDHLYYCYFDQYGEYQLQKFGLES